MNRFVDMFEVIVISFKLLNVPGLLNVYMYVGNSTIRLSSQSLLYIGTEIAILTLQLKILY